MAQLPSARIYIEVQETGEVILMDTFVSIETDLRIDGASSATIQLTNRADRWYTFNSRDVKRQTDLSQFLLEAYNEKRYFEINQKRQSLLDEARKLSGQKQIAALNEIITMDQLIMFNLPYRIWIDFRGRKDLIDLQQQDSRKYRDLPDRWYAGFTGVITNIEDFLEIGKSQSITLSCRDMKRVFETTLLTTDLGVNPLIKLDTDIVEWSKRYYTTSLASYADGASIIKLATFNANRIFGPSYQHDLWQLPDSTHEQTANTQQPNVEVVTPTYLGITNRRTPKGFSNFFVTSDRANIIAKFAAIQSKNVTFNQKKADVIRFIQENDVLRDFVGDVRSIRGGFHPDVFINAINQMVQGQDTYQGADYSVDKMIVNGNAKSNPYQQLIKGSFNWETQRITAEEAIKAVAGLTGYCCYCDAKGNLIYQKTRYDDFPGSERETNYDEADQSISLPMRDEIGQYSKNDRQSIGMRFHGRNYIIGNESLISRRINKSDTNIVTHVLVPPVINNLTTAPELTKYATGVAFADPDITRRFGLRLHYAQQLVLGSWNKLLPQILAEGIVRKLNSTIETCDVNLNMRPDLQLGRTMYLMERRRLFFITGVRNSLTWGKRHDTSLTGEYGHHPYEPILDPWRIASLGKTDIAQEQQQNNIASAGVLEQVIEKTLLSENAK